MSANPRVDFSDLEALLPGNREAEDAASDESTLQGLDALLASTLTERAQREQYDRDLKARKRGFVGMSVEEVAFCNSRMLAFEAARIWQTELNLAVFTRFHCACGEARTIFTRWMVQQRGRVNVTSRRWLTMDHQVRHLPVKPTYEVRQVDLCTVCAVLQGVDTHGMQELQEAFK